jgi:hypothetical protein
MSEDYLTKGIPYDKLLFSKPVWGFMLPQNRIRSLQKNDGHRRIFVFISNKNPGC